MKLIWKKLGIILVIALIWTTPVYSGGSAEEVKGNSDNEKEGVELTILSWRYTPDDEFWLRVVEEYKAVKPNVTLKLVSVSDNDFMEQKAAAMLAGNQPLDIVWTDSSVNQSMGKSNLLEPLEPYIEKDNFDLSQMFMTSKNDHMWEEELVGLPAIPMAYLIFYNKDLFDAMGVPYPTNDWTMSEFLEIAKKMTNTKEKQFGYGTRPWIGTHDLAFVYAFGGRWFNDQGESVVDSPETIKGYQFIQDLIQKYNVAPAPSGVAGSSSQAVTFDSGKLAMNWSGTWDIKGTEGDNSKWDFRWGVVLPPKGVEGQFPVVISNGWSIIKSSEYKNEAWDFLKWWSTGVVQVLLTQYGEIPPNIDYANDFAIKHLSEADRETVFKAFEIGVSRPTQWPYWARSERESNAYRDRIYMGEDTKIVLTEMKENIDNIIESNQ